jgi:polyphosphate glucokinase
VTAGFVPAFAARPKTRFAISADRWKSAREDHMPKLHDSVAARDPVANAGPPNRPLKVLVVDIGGTHVKVLATGQTVHRQFDSGKNLTPRKMLAAIRPLVADWEYEVVSMGFPGPIRNHRPAAEPWNLGKGWLGFNFRSAFKCPVQMLNDAAMQALGSYRRGKMLFLGLGTGLGSTLIAEGQVIPLELAHLPYRSATFEDYVGIRGLEKYGKKKWRKFVADVVSRLMAALEPDEVVLGGGNVRQLKQLPPHCRAGNNDNAFRGGFRLWATPMKRNGEAPRRSA